VSPHFLVSTSFLSGMPFIDRFTDDITVGLKKKSYDDVILFTNIMTDGMPDRVILSVNPLIIFNL
jgi:hypothetical protein